MAFVYTCALTACADAGIFVKGDPTSSGGGGGGGGGGGPNAYFYRTPYNL